MTGRYPHNNGVDCRRARTSIGPHSMACYLRSAGYATYIAGKFLTTWPRTQTPPCFDHSTVMWGGYNDVGMRTDGVWKTMQGYSTTYLGNRGREYITSALGLGKPFLLYETPQAPHWVGRHGQRHRDAARCPRTEVRERRRRHLFGGPRGRPERQAHIRAEHRTSASASAQLMCQSQLRAIMSADDEFAATMQLLVGPRRLGEHAGDLLRRQRLHVGRARPLGEVRALRAVDPGPAAGPLAWPRHRRGRTRPGRSSYLDILPTMLEAAGFTLAGLAPRASTGSRSCRPSTPDDDVRRVLPR